MEPVTVVGVALVAEGPTGRPRVLAARRSSPPAGAGRARWELPGGKNEPGEDLAAAAVRELREELGCQVRVTGALPGAVAVDERHVLRVVTARIAAGEPLPLEHDALRWLAEDELDEVGWLPPDVPFLSAVRELLRSGSG